MVKTPQHPPPPPRPLPQNTLQKKWINPRTLKTAPWALCKLMRYSSSNETLALQTTDS